MDRVIKSTWTIQEAKNSAPNFPTNVKELFKDVKKNFKSWIDDFMIYSKTKEQFIHTLSQFLTIC